MRKAYLEGKSSNYKIFKDIYCYMFGRRFTSAKREITVKDYKELIRQSLIIASNNELNRKNYKNKE